MINLCRCLPLCALLALTGCAEIIGEVVCLSGICASEEERLSSIPWSPPVLKKNNCPNIGGAYYDEESPESRLSQHLWLSDKIGPAVNREDYKKIPFTPIQKQIKYVSGKPTAETIIIEDQSIFYKSAITVIGQDENILEATLMDNKGTKYKKSILNLNHPQIGCDSGALIIREVSASGGAEGALGSAYASETRYSKLPDGRLHMSVQSRNWYYSSSRGLIGIGAGGNDSGTEPRKGNSTSIFKVAPYPARAL